MILLLDNFDSFTFNLADYFSQLNVKCDVQRNDVSLEEIIHKNYAAVVLSPGPSKPEDAGIMMKIIEHYHKKLPILGICLGHQALGQFFGATLKKSHRPMHGKISEMTCLKDEIFKDIPEKIQVVRYHSIIVSNISQELEVIAYDTQGEIMAIKHKSLPIYGLQYHPEAILTEYGKEILKNWIFLYKITD